nr:Protein translocase subunit secA [Moritella viscosa]
MEAIVFSECDVIENFIEKVKENHGVENWDDGDLVEFIRDIQHEMINDLVSYTTLSLESYIDNNFDSQTDFAEKQGVKLPQVTQWIKKNFVVIDDVLYSSRRDLNI